MGNGAPNAPCVCCVFQSFLGLGDVGVGEGVGRWAGNNIPADLILLSPNPETQTFVSVVQRGKKTTQNQFF